ncbi:hypothetical protein [Saccharothrix sp. HUAS TT1]|uniref:hypothetical protein n=1 Tax=unclassified Saccharothrix TaxID=2593673 RepID=UPI00345B757E
MVNVHYSSNNSGGYWWLTDENWKALEAAGWEVEWEKDRPKGWWTDSDSDGERFLGGLAHRATRRGVPSVGVAIAEFEAITGESAYADGCECCGPPHNFYEVDDNGRWISDGLV